MKQFLGEVTANITLGPTTRILRVRAPEIAGPAVAGQFVHVRTGDGGADPLLRRPYSIFYLPQPATAPAGREELALLVEVVGRGSEILAGARVGDALDLLGPLGRGFALAPKSRQILLVAGGVGIAPLLALAVEALAKDVAVTLLFGARTAARVFPPAFVPPAVEYVVLTDDGSLGHKGLVVSALPEYLDWADQVFACGPEPMLRALAGALRERAWAEGASPSPPSKPKRNEVGRGNEPFAQVSLEQHMGCAMGACYGCVVETVRGRQRVCRDGPVFDLRSVVW